MCIRSTRNAGLPSPWRYRWGCWGLLWSTISLSVSLDTSARRKSLGMLRERTLEIRQLINSAKILSNKIIPPLFIAWVYSLTSVSAAAEITFRMNSIAKRGDPGCRK